MLKYLFTTPEFPWDMKHQSITICGRKQLFSSSLMLNIKQLNCSAEGHSGCCERAPGKSEIIFVFWWKTLSSKKKKVL